jgi:Protein of unknown function (DUF1573)
LILKPLEMKKIIFTLVIALMTGLGFAQKGSKIDFEAKDNTIDYGTITKNDSGIRTFEFTNTGDAPLIITSIQSTSGCTVVSKPTAPVLPGKSGKIEIKYTVVPGPIRKTITVEYNALNPEDCRVALKIKGDVSN